jgi:hypothetical protein
MAATPFSGFNRSTISTSSESMLSAANGSASSALTVELWPSADRPSALSRRRFRRTISVSTAPPRPGDELGVGVSCVEILGDSAPAHSACFCASAVA